MVVLTALTVATAKPHHHHLLLKTLNSKHSSKPISNVSLESNSSTKGKIFDLGIGLLAASMVLTTPLEANATRIEYYATVAEPSCELKYVKSGLGYCDIAPGIGTEAPRGELIDVHYTARFADGTVFDSSYKRGRALTMRIGVGKVIKGLDQGIGGGEGVPPMLVAPDNKTLPCSKQGGNGSFKFLLI
ncbi:hypothetical protein AQUCO_01400553v1 [Aquilegia coerulea]|uniref:peptidylprolyl isomerase n=1 Tax=Aquilegia coerulea TaxID=218851 RepID=A0A2G5DX03_AQUCA|nr:hypothetical protein AQUCO_01400553v1 [Aquilegia coerulea]PIA48042.1 hypothetical protein AQUCO_01400553v1 [Aquilegia coerulea]